MDAISERRGTLRRSTRFVKKPSAIAVLRNYYGILESIAEFLPCHGFSLASLDKDSHKFRELFGTVSILKRPQPYAFEPKKKFNRIVVRISKPGADAFDLTRCAGCNEFCEPNKRLSRRDRYDYGDGSVDYDLYDKPKRGYIKDSTMVTRECYFKYCGTYGEEAYHNNQPYGDQEDLCADCISKLCKCVACGREGCRFCRFLECAGEDCEARMCRHGNMYGYKCGHAYGDCGQAPGCSYVLYPEFDQDDPEFDEDDYFKAEQTQYCADCAPAGAVQFFGMA